MNASALKGLMISKLQAAGFDTENEHSKTPEFCEAIAAAVIEHIQANAKAVVASGSSAGQHPIQ
jgi:hypothetical protein